MDFLSRFGHQATGCGRLKCRNCGASGHGAADCKEPKVCNGCGVQGHVFRDCPARSRTYAEAAGGGKDGDSADAADLSLRPLDEVIGEMMAEGLPLTGPTESVAEAVAESVLEEVGQPPKVWADEMDGLLSGLSDEEMEASKARRPRSPSADGGVGSAPVEEAGVSPVARGRKKRRKEGVAQEVQEASFAVENRYAVLNPDFGGELGAGGDDSLLLGLPEAIAIDSGGQGSGDSGVVPETALSDLASASVLGTDQLVSQLEGHGVEDVDSSSSPEHAFVAPISPNSVDYLVQVVFTADVPAFGRGFWKLNCSVLQDSSFKEDFKAHYEVWVGLKPFFTSLLDWWDCLKTNVRAFAVSFCSTRAWASRAAFVGLQRELSSLVAAENRGEAPDQDRMAVVRSDLEAYFKGKARDFFFRCRREKVELGEVCGAYFFKQVRAARAKVVISGLRTEGGTVVHDPAGLVKAASAFYGASFRVGSVDSSKAESFLGFLEGRVPPDIAGSWCCASNSGLTAAGTVSLIHGQGRERKDQGGGKERLSFIRKLRPVLLGYLPVVVAGDFNCALRDVDRSRPRNDCSSRELIDIINEYQLQDLGRDLVPRYTWVSSNGQSFSRIDLHLLEPTLTASGTTSAATFFSDHRQLTTTVHLPDRQTNRGKGLWKLNTTLLTDTLNKQYITQLTNWTSLLDLFDSPSDWWEMVKERTKHFYMKADFYSNLYTVKTTDDDLIDGLLKHIAPIPEEEEEGDLSPEELTRAMQTLSTGKGDAAQLRNWRPISLLGSDYKILAKALMYRLQRSLPRAVGSDQTCGVPGRSALDNLSAVRDIFAHSAERSQPFCLFNLDQEKAFDRVSHPYMLKGYPLSALLYTIAIEPLLTSIRSNPLIIGYPLPGAHGMTLKTQAYMDDITIITTSPRSIPQITHSINIFCRATGAIVNETKSEVYVTPDWPADPVPPYPKKETVNILAVCFGGTNPGRRSWKDPRQGSKENRWMAGAIPLDDWLTGSAAMTLQSSLARSPPRSPPGARRQQGPICGLGDVLDSWKTQARHYKTLQEMCRSKKPNKASVTHLLNLEFESRRRFITSDIVNEQDQPSKILEAYSCFKDLDHVTSEDPDAYLSQRPLFCPVLLVYEGNCMIAIGNTPVTTFDKKKIDEGLLYLLGPSGLSLKIFNSSRSSPPYNKFKAYPRSDTESKVVTVKFHNECIQEYDIETWLNRYATIKSEGRRVLDEDQVWTTGVGGVRHLPSTITLGNNRGSVHYYGMPKLCRNCGNLGHLAAACTACKICQAYPDTNTLTTRHHTTSLRGAGANPHLRVAVLGGGG
ncbi:hypothetical protein DPEC_G00325260 [Dallia pectoralis]|uniref:Uncharacterized protein n=1 Tax=Dallia pectoralis TaxID=75939 RepID=A0ACC2FB74_DALPE|nr:hypothetical protein DPEC_G00325260 [Dallia pectoralis]